MSDNHDQGERFKREAELLANVKTLVRDVEELTRQQKALWDRFDGRDGITREIEAIKLDEVKANAGIDAKFTERVAVLEKALDSVKREELARDFKQRMQVAQLAWKVSLVIGGILFVLNLVTRNIDLGSLLGINTEQRTMRKK